MATLNRFLRVFVVFGNVWICCVPGQEIGFANGAAETGSCSLMESVNKIFNITETIRTEIDAVQFARNVPLKREYDFVIVGSGPSGCVLANRLSSDNYSVLLLEAGSAENPMFTNIPMGASNLQLTDYNWNYATEPQENACLSMQDQRCNWPHGRGLGGSSIINYMIYTRGNRRDFDKIAAAGNPGWSYESVLPFFQKFEKSVVTSMDENDSFGRSGLLQVEDAQFRTPIATAFVESAQRLNYSNINYNSGDQIGVSYLQSSTKNGWRQTAARAFLSSVRHRPNLDISLRSWATKLLFNSHGDQVKAVKFFRNRREYTVKVRKEVILAAGAIQSPKLLMLSGIGPEAHLKDLDIKVVKNLPVGQTLYEHMAVYGPIFTADNITDGLINMNDVLQLKPIFELLEGKGPLTSTGIEALLYMKTNNSVNADPNHPDIELLQSFATVAFDTAQGIREGIRLSEDVYDIVFKPLENQRAFQMLPMLLHPRSKGYLKLKSRNPFHHPKLYPNFFADARDIDTLLEGIREAIKIAEQPEFQELGVKLYNASIPGCETAEFDSDAYWRCYIRHLSATLHHQIGTCKMGPHTDQTAVVDANARVHGIRNLRVADVSILPESPSGHTAAFSFLIGEKIAASIRNDWKPKESNIQRLTRHKKSLDWQYQDPEHTTEPRIIPTTSQRYPINQHITTMRTKQTTTNLETMNVLHALNMSALLEHSHQFQNSTIGDVGIILWGSLTASKTIDFKTKLAENTNLTNSNETINEINKNNNKKPRILRPTSSKPMTDATTSKPVITTITSTETFTESSTIGTAAAEEATTLPVPTTNGNSFESTEAGAVVATVATTQNPERTDETTTIQLSTAMSNMAKILATAPTLDEDAIKTYELSTSEKRGASKDKFITKQIKLRNSTSFLDETTMNAATTIAESTTATDALQPTTEIITETQTQVVNNDLVANQTKTVQNANSVETLSQKSKSK